MRKFAVSLLLSSFCLFFQNTSVAQAFHLNDTWAFDLKTNTWTEILPVGALPEARRFSPHAYDSRRNRLLVAGGSDVSALFSNTWALDLTKGSEVWALLSTSNPHPGIAFHGGVYDSRRDLFVAFHSPSHIDVLDLATNTWSTRATSGTNLDPVTTHSVIYDAVNDRYVLFGGGVGADPTTYTNRVKLLDANTLVWTELSFPLTLPLPPPRNLTRTVYDSSLERLLLFGGALPGGFGGGRSLEDAWQLTLNSGSETWIQFRSPVAPLDRAQQAAAFDEKRGRMIVFGGLHYFDFTSFASMNDIWFFDGSDWTNPFPFAPRPMTRRGASAVYDIVSDRFILFGGEFIPAFVSFVDALVRIDPKTLNLKSKGKWVTCCITLPDGFDIADIDVSTVGIAGVNQRVIDPPLFADNTFGGQWGDCDGNLVPDLTIKFDRQQLVNLPLPIGDVGVTIRGELTTGDFFSGSDVIRTIGGKGLEKSFSREENETAIPDDFALFPNYPNPFNPTTTIRFAIPDDVNVNLAVYNTLGQMVAQLVDGPMSAGYHDVHFDAAQLASGVYVYKLQAGDFLATQKLIVLR